MFCVHDITQGTQINTEATIVSDARSDRTV
jgi:hypothetical protein